MQFDNFRSGLLAGAALLCLATQPARAQTTPDPVPAPPPDIRDFSLPPAGNTASPAPAPAPVPAPAPAPVVAAPAPVVNQTQSAPPPTASTRRRNVSPRTPAPARRTPVAETPSAAPSPGFAEQPAALPPEDAAAATPAPPVAEPAPAASQVAEAAPAKAQGVPSWLYWLLPAAAGLALLGWLLKRRRSPNLVVEEQVDESEMAEQPDIGAEPILVAAAEDEAEVAPAAAPISATDVETQPRLEVIFKPAAASATDAQAAVEFTLTVVNNGDAPARRVRIEARMFAMGTGHDAALAEFAAGPMERPVAVAAVIEPGVQAVLRNQVTLPREHVHPIQVQNRSLFVPLVAFNLLYEYGDEQVGQNMMSFVVGRETRPPAAKMAPFRLDQGPRIYREVGHRVHVPPQAA